MATPKIANLGCGSKKVSFALNVDINAANKPDLVHDITQPFPEEYHNTFKAIYLFHTIEHIQKARHETIIKNIKQIMKGGGELYITYPDFQRCAENYISDKNGMRSFWEATIYGRQSAQWDFHVCAIDQKYLGEILKSCGFTDIQHAYEHREDYNGITSCIAGDDVPNYEQLIVTETSRYVIK